MATSLGKQRILVTGATGFVGRSLMEFLEQKGMDPVPASRSGAPSAPELLDPAPNWLPFLERVSCVVHLAARVHQMGETGAEALMIYRKANVEGTLRLAEAAARAGVRRFVFLSSVKAVGEETVQDAPWTEASAPHPMDPYGISKLEAEEALFRMHEQGKFEVVVLRPPLVYGRGVKANFLRLVRMVEKGIPLPLKSARNRRSLLYLGNLSDAVHAALTHPGASGKRFFVSDGRPVSTSELISTIASHLHVRPHLLPAPGPLLELAGKVLGKADEVKRLTRSLEVSNSRICTELQWKPPFTFDQGVAQTVKWYQESRRT